MSTNPIVAIRCPIGFVATVLRRTPPFDGDRGYRQIGGRIAVDAPTLRPALKFLVRVRVHTWSVCGCPGGSCSDLHEEFACGRADGVELCVTMREVFVEDVRGIPTYAIDRSKSAHPTSDPPAGTRPAPGRPSCAVGASSWNPSRQTAEGSSPSESLSNRSVWAAGNKLAGTTAPRSASRSIRYHDSNPKADPNPPKCGDTIPCGALGHGMHHRIRLVGMHRIDGRNREYGTDMMRSSGETQSWASPNPSCRHSVT